MVVFALARVAVFFVLAQLGLVGVPVGLDFGVGHGRAWRRPWRRPSDRAGGLDRLLEEVHRHALLLEDGQHLRLAAVRLLELGDLGGDFLVGDGDAELPAPWVTTCVLHEVARRSGRRSGCSGGALRRGPSCWLFICVLAWVMSVLKCALVIVMSPTTATASLGTLLPPHADAARPVAAIPSSATAAIRTVVTRLIRVPLSLCARIAAGHRRAGTARSG